MVTVCDHLSVEELEERYVRCQDATASRHSHVIWLLARGHAVSQVSTTTAFGERWIEQLLARYNAEGPEALRPLGVVTSEQLFNPSLAKGCCCRHLRNGVTPRQKPDHMGMPRCGGVLTSNVSLFQLLHAQMIADCHHVSKSPDSWRSRLSASQGRVNPPFIVKLINRKPY